MSRHTAINHQPSHAVTAARGAYQWAAYRWSQVDSRSPEEPRAYWLMEISRLRLELIEGAASPYSVPSRPRWLLKELLRQARTRLMEVSR